MRTLSVAIAGAAFLLIAISHAAIEPQTFDTSVRPQDDFYQYVNGQWLKTVQIPADLARYASFNKLQEDNWAKLHQICDGAAAKGDQASGPERIVGDFYASGMDAAAINAGGAKPLQEEFDRIAAIQTPEDVLRVLGHLRMLGVHAGFWFSASPDDKNSTMEIATISQSGLGLAASDAGRDQDRDYYFNPDPKSQQLRQEYVAHIAKMFELQGDHPEAARSGAERVMKLETELARVSSTRVQLRDPDANYHKLKVADLPAVVGNLDLKAFLSQTNAPQFTELNVEQPDFLKGFVTQLTATPVDDWKLYLRWQLIRRTAEYLSDNYAAEHFNFFGRAMTGAAEQEPRWKRVVENIDGDVGDALGQLYVEHFFPPAAKARALALVANVRAALRHRLETVDWMDAPTRAKAVAKLDAFTVKIGYPDKWKDYTSAHIDRGPFVLNELRATEYEARRNLAKIGGPVDKTEWLMTPPTVNAYYSPSVNGITFPAGMLQPPFFDPNADDALNYGGIGIVIGHEMTHGFDDQGRKFDAKGNLNDWWSPQSAQQFEQRAQKIVDQFSAYTVADGVHLNGKLTEGENIADLGGARVAFAALETVLGDKPRTKIDGFTPEQRFFISDAMCWRDIMRPAEAIRRARVDPHSPGKYRIDGPLSNLDEFYKAFNVPEGAPMRRPENERVKIW